MYKFLSKTSIYSLVVFFAFITLPHLTSAAVLLPGNISTCGELAVPGTYTITQNIAGGSDTCFLISSDNIFLEGGGFTITGTGLTAIDARAYTSSVLTEGANGYTNIVINDITISGYTTGINLSGNSDSTGDGVNNGSAGDGGDIAIYYSVVGSVISNGGDSSTQSFGGLGGNILFTNIDLDISNSLISALGGTGTSGSNTSGGLDVNYSGTLTSVSTSLSSFSYFNNNATYYGAYPGGTWPLLPGNISTCGTLYATTTSTFTLTQDISNISGTCFTLFGNDITIDGAGYSISSATSTNTSFAISAGSYSNFTLASTTVTDFSNLVTSNSSVTISGHDLDLSDQYIEVSTLTINYTGTLSKIGATVSDLSDLIVNGTSYGAQTAGQLFDWILRDSSQNWRSIASSADGTKLAAVVNNGRIHTSTDSGVTWTARDSGLRNWLSITSSADGTKLAATVYGGQIYTSSDSGVTWTAQASGSRNWYSITSSADGTKLAAVVNFGQIYISTDSGVNWTVRGPSENWLSIASSADGTKLAAVAYGGKIYTSTDSGLTWTLRDSSRHWTLITSSADGTKLAATVYGGQIYTSTDSGVTWTARASGSRDWYSITSSADGTKIAAGVSYGQIYTSTDSGLTWTARESSRSWYSITSSADGTKLAAVTVGSTRIYTHEDDYKTLKVDILIPQSSASITSWQPIVSWGSATSCYYSYDNWVSTSTANCASLGSDISDPGYGSKTLYVKGIDINNVVVEKNASFNLGLPITITTPTIGSTITSWDPDINWDPYNVGNITECYYSYDNFVSTSTSNCSSVVSDIFPPTALGTTTLYLKIFDSNGNIGVSNVNFVYNPNVVWVTVDSSRQWYSITSSADGTKLAAVVYGGQIYTSIDSGATWAPQASGSRNWYSITSSADGTKLAAAAYSGQIYTSTDSGVTWTAQASGSRSWYSITSSSDGTKLAAVVTGGQIYTSPDSGVTWTAQASGSRSWRSITSSSDGTKLAAVVTGGQIYTSTDSGVTWTAQASGSRSWRSITSSSDGTKLAAAVYGGQIYTSLDSGVTWTARDSSRQWYSITSSSDGTKLAASVYNGQIYTSTDSGITWIASDSSRQWYSITSSADGTKLAAAVYNGQIYTYNSGSSVSIIRPYSESFSIARTWSALVNWGVSVSCYYSYDNWVSTSTVNCANTGSDITYPLVAGNQNLYVKGIDALNNITTQISNFNFEFLTWIARDSSRGWQSITSSADGTKLAAAVYNGQIYTSTDSGVSWTAQASGSRNWQSITSSSDGTKFAAVAYGGQIYTSPDSGVTWIARDSIRNWESITSSSDGTKLAAAAYSTQIYTSTDSGVTWTPQASGSRGWHSITSSADGTKLAAVAWNSQIYTSSDSGVTWTGRDFLRYWRSITSSADGTKLAATVDDGQIYTSTDSGVTWTARDSGSRNWNSITSSADGTKLAAAVNVGQIYTSTDSGITWTTNESARQWGSITSSADGLKLAAAVNYGYIYISTPAPVVTNPAAASIINVWSPSVNWSNSLTCEYSYDNSTWSSASCSGTGSDIPVPTSSGLNTLYVKGTDFQNTVSTSSVSFSYSQILSENSISSCGTISMPGTYTLTQDVTDVTGTCFIIATNNVIIDGAGYTVTAQAGNTSYAVTSGSYTGLILSNINFSGFEQGDISSTVSVTYSGDTIDLSNSTTTVSSLIISYVNSLTVLNTYFSNLSSLIINNIDLGSFVAGLFTWNDQTISTCQTLSSPGTYTLTADITDVSGTCFNITSDRVIIDGDNHTISGANGNTDYAVVSALTDSNAYNYTAVKNLTLTGFGGGVDARGSDGISGDTTGKLGGIVILYNVIFPTNTISVNTSGGDGFYENNTTAQGGNAGNVKVINSTVGTINISGGDTNGDLLVGYDNGTVNGGLVGSVTNTNSTIVVTLSNQGVGYIPGCMDNNFDSYNSLATYDDGSCTDLVIGSERDNPLGNTVIGPIDFNYYTNYGVIDGDANFYDNKIDNSSGGGGHNYGTTTGHATFNNSYSGSGANNYGYVGDGADFGYYSSNYGTINGTTTFENGGNQLGAIINGNVDFTQGGNYEGYNEGIVNGDATFIADDEYYGTYNYGAVTGTIYVYYGCTDPLAANYNPNAFNDSGICIYYGQNSDLPEGVTFTGDLNFDGYSNYGTINGNASFLNGGANYGTTTGDVSFYDYFTGESHDSADNTLYVDGSFDYYGTGIVGGTMYDGTGMEISSINFINGVENEYTTQGDSVFNDTTYNSSNIIGNATFNTTYYASTTPTDGVMSFETADWAGSVTGQVLGSDLNPITTYVFYGDTINNGDMVGNAVFYNNAYNAGNITGNVVYMNATNGTLNLTGFQQWAGTVSDTIKGNDDIEITNLIFNDSSTNETTIEETMTTVFNDTSSNNGTIEGDASFNGVSFRVGTVNGSATLSGLTQTIQGLSNVLNFIKHTLARDTLYVEEGAILNISGLATLLGADANNLLAIKSTSADETAQININGTSNINFLRFKNILNIGLLQDVSVLNIFDDGGNSGFTFNLDRILSLRGGITGIYTVPSPPSRGGNTGGNTDGGTGGNTNTNGGSSSRGFLRDFIKNISRPITSIPVQSFIPTETNLIPQTIQAVESPDLPTSLPAPIQTPEQKPWGIFLLGILLVLLSLTCFWIYRRSRNKSDMAQKRNDTIDTQITNI